MKKSSRLNLLRASAIVGLVAAAACTREQPFPPELRSEPRNEKAFQFELSSEEAFEAQVTLDGAPLRFASVIVTDSLVPDPDGKWMEEPRGGNVYYRGTTDAQGRVAASVRIPTSVDAVDLVVDRAGASGPYTFESFREYWGPFAPSSRTTLIRRFLRRHQVDLESH